MPLLSREVVTLRLILECDDGGDDDDVALEELQSASPLIRLPTEIRLEILRYLLCIDCNRKAHTRRPPRSSISELLYLNPRRILEAAPFKHKGNQEINGSPPIIKSCQLHTAVLKTCKKLYEDGTAVLYKDNKVFAVQAGIKGLGAKLKNYGVPVLGPFPAWRLKGGSHTDSDPSPLIFKPLILFSGRTSNRDAPFYVTSHIDGADLLHALWILVKSPFARGMQFDLTLSTALHPRHASRTDSFLKLAVLPWLHANIDYLQYNLDELDREGEEQWTMAIHTFSDRKASIGVEYQKHRAAQSKEPNLHLYRSVCDYLEQILLQGEMCVDQGNFVSGELSFERVCYEACSLVRTRTSALVDVSSRSKDGINRICKLIAVSAFRLCELRSGSLAQLILKKQRKQKATKESISDTEPAEAPTSANISNEEDAENSEDSASVHTDEASSVSSVPSAAGTRDSRDTVSPEVVQANQNETKVASPTSPPLESTTAKTPILPRTSRLELGLARDLALTSGLLALRLPCASPVPEWNIRLDNMLLRLFAWRNDASNAVWCIRRIHNNGAVVLNSVKQKNKANDKKWEPFNALVQELAQQLKPGAPKDCFLATADKIEHVIISLWGERLIPKRGFNGLIWTFRWAG